MDGLITIVCYKNCEIIDGPYGVGYSCPPDRGILVNNMITYDELEDKLCHVMSIDHAHTKLSMVFRYPILMPIGNGNINYVQLPIKDGNDVKLIFHFVAQIPPSNTIEMYLQTCPMDHFCRQSIPFNEENATNDMEILATSDAMRANFEMDTNEAKGTLAIVTQSVIIASKNFVDIPITNEDDGVELYGEEEINEQIYVDEPDDEPPINKTSLDGNQHFMPSPMFKQLNSDVINNMPYEPITTQTGLWNGSSQLFKGLRFESKDDLQYVVNCNLISHNQHLVVCESQPHLWAVRCKKWNEGCNWRFRACRRKSHGLFEITKYVSLHTYVYPRLSQDHSQLGSKLIAREIQNVVQRDHMTSIATLHLMVKDKFGYDVHYKKNWEAKGKTMIKAFGD